jgi:hypothetical protein
MTTPPVPAGPHGAAELPMLRVDAYNAELQDPEGHGFLGDRASNRAFMEMLDDWRRRVQRGAKGEDPIEEALGEDRPTRAIERAELDEMLDSAREDPEAAGLVHSAIEDFAQDMAAVVRRFLRLPEWQGTERIAVGGGFLEAKVGLMAVGRVGVLLRAAGEEARLVPVLHHPDDAALCGAPRLAPPALLEGYDACLAVDIGGTNIRAGLVALGQAPSVLDSERWKHAEEAPGRDQAVAKLAALLGDMVAQAEAMGRRLAPFIGIGCPGIITPDGRIARGGQNLPGGNWEDEDFHLPDALAEAIPSMAGQAPLILMHNDAVVQGLSQMPAMRDVRSWGVLTIGTGLGNARFSNVD